MDTAASLSAAFAAARAPLIPSTRARLLEAAARLFLSQGFGAVSMDGVRQRAGVSNGSLYHHFPTKAHLADALYAHTLRDFHAALLAPLTGCHDAEAGVKGLVRAYVQWVLRHPDGARLLHELRRAEGADGSEMNAANARALAVLAAWIAPLVDAGALLPLPLPLWMALVFAPAISLTPHWVAGGKPAVAPKVRAALEQAAWMAVCVPPAR